MNRFPLRILVFIGVFALPFTAGADCMGPYPPSMVKAFDQSCAKDPKMMSFCSCLMDEVQKNIPLSDFIEIGNSVGGINDDPRFQKASKKCSPLVPAGAGMTSPSPTISNSSKYRNSGILR